MASVLFFLAVVAPSDSCASGLQDLQLKLEQVSWSPMPFQAVRLRLCVLNNSAARVGPVHMSESNIEIYIKGPQDEEWGKVPKYLAWKANRTSAPTARESINNRSPLFIEPGDRAFVSLAVVADWVTVKRQAEGEAPKIVQVARPLFHRPGKYALKCLLRHEAQPNLQLEQVIEIEVSDARGDDEAVLLLLKKDKALITAAMRPVDPPEEALIPKLKDLVERYPKSSYADYARFALARAYRRGVGVHPQSDRVARAMAADQLEKIIVSRYDFKSEKTVPSRFAYLPNALIYWKSAEPLGREHTLRRLDRAFPDAVEWLEVVAASLLSSKSEGSKDAEFVLDKKFPSPLTVPPPNTKAFIADAWKSYRQRVPNVEEDEARRTP